MAVDPADGRCSSPAQAGGWLRGTGFPAVRQLCVLVDVVRVLARGQSVTVLHYDGVLVAPSGSKTAGESSQGKDSDW